MADGDKIVNAQLAETVETLQRELEASKKRRSELQERYDKLEKLYNDQRRSILEDVVEAFEEITEAQDVPEAVRKQVRSILDHLRGR